MEAIKNDDTYFNELIVQYFSETISDEDLLKLNTWLELKPDHKRFFDETRELWLISKVAENSKKFDSRDGFQRFLSGVKKLKMNRSNNVSKIMFLSLPRVAAVAAIIFGLGVLVNHFIVKIPNRSITAWQEIEVPLGSKTSIKLPDGTEVKLNSGSKLSYQANYGISNRAVILKGEGFFSVAKNKEVAFEVKTEYINIKALGTEFNVKAYAEDNDLQVTLFEGSVGLYDSENVSESIVELMPNQQAVYNKQNKKMKVGNVNAKLYGGWQDDKYYFENETFANVAVVIERKFNVKIKIISKDLSAETFTGTIDAQKTVYQLLDGLGRYANFTYKLKNDTIEIQRK